jgi:hypothetical protein
MDKHTAELVKVMVDTKRFVEKYEGWHSFSTRCKWTVKAVHCLKQLGILEVNEFNQMRKI